jgi:hypothetical protein
MNRNKGRQFSDIEGPNAPLDTKMMHLYPSHWTFKTSTFYAFC